MNGAYRWFNLVTFMCLTSWRVTGVYSTGSNNMRICLSNEAVLKSLVCLSINVEQYFNVRLMRVFWEKI